MSKVPYIDYNDLKEFYTIKETCKLFEISKAELRAYSEEFAVEPRMNEIGEHGFPRYDIRKLHNAIYYSDRDCSFKESDPWA